MKRSIVRAGAATFCIVFLGLTACTSPAGQSAASSGETASDYVQYDAIFSDWASRYIECARSFGADAQLTKDGGITQPYAKGRPVKEGLDAECLKEVGPAPDTPPLNDAFLAGLYELYVQQAACLREHDYAISAPPSREQWVENYGAKSWNPLMDVNKSGRDVQEADSMCPQPEPREAERLGNSFSAGKTP